MRFRKIVKDYKHNMELSKIDVIFKQEKIYIIIDDYMSYNMINI